MKINSILKIVLISFCALLFTNGKVHAIESENITAKGYFLSYTTPTDFSRNFTPLQKTKSVGTIKIPRGRRKYFRDEKTTAIFDFTDFSFNRYFITSVGFTTNTDWFPQTTFSLSLLRAPPLV